MKRYKGILAIDFDDTIAKSNYPEIIGEIDGAKEYINKLYEDGWYIIIWTCRCNDNNDKRPLQMAIDWLEESGIKYHNINDHHESLIHFYGNDTRKIAADYYIDDKNLGGLLPWNEIYNILCKHDSITSLDRYYKAIDLLEEIHE